MSLAEQFRIGHWLADILGISTAAQKAAATVFLLDLLEAAETATESQFSKHPTNSRRAGLHRETWIVPQRLDQQLLPVIYFYPMPKVHLE